jgi:hypothetical protein
LALTHHVRLFVLSEGKPSYASPVKTGSSAVSGVEGSSAALFSSTLSLPVVFSGARALSGLVRLLVRGAHLDAVLLQLLLLHRRDARELSLGASPVPPGVLRQVLRQVEVALLAGIQDAVAALRRADGDECVAVRVHRTRGQVPGGLVVLGVAVAVGPGVGVRVRGHRLGELVGGGLKVAFPPFLLPLVP